MRRVLVDCLDLSDRLGPFRGVRSLALCDLFPSGTPGPEMHKPRSSRRAPPLKDSDYDHEIILVDSAADDTDDAVGDANSDGAAVDAAGRSASPSVISASNTALETGDGAGSAATSRRPSGIAPTSTSGPALSPVVTATSLTPLLNTLSTVPTTNSTKSHSPSRGRKTTRYGSVSKTVAAPLGGAPSVQVEGESRKRQE